MNIMFLYKYYKLHLNIKRLLNEINLERTKLVNRSETYHDGRLNVDDLIKDYSSERMRKVYEIKRDLIKLRQEKNEESSDR